MSSLLYQKKQKYDDIAEIKYSCGFARVFSDHAAWRDPKIARKKEAVSRSDRPML